GTHALKLAKASDGSDVAGGSVSVSMAGCMPGQFVYAALPAAISLPAGGTFYLVSAETTGADQWYDYAPITTTSGVAAVNGSVYSTGTQWVTVGSPSTSYVPVNFLSGSGTTGLTVSIVPP